MTELSYQLPDEAARRGDFERLFSELERSHDDLGVSSFGISDTSLEEVGAKCETFLLRYVFLLKCLLSLRK
ncbi:hypothetical protein DPMN_131024 [Dreissena polymorpha]|uniref:Uncharacterized protein n=1 Tax=Dreissena polymorpha TaxID=45954 RepID=A0A9D4H3V8_DREPO|nr:hypothetical protein DPMN_131024 [Dreissena polymorpha]